MSGIKEHPWLAKAEVVRAILCGRQTQDRRPLKTQMPSFERDGSTWFVIKGKHYRTGNFYYDQKDGSSLYPFGMDELIATFAWQSGTHIWIRETFRAWCTDLTGTIRDGQWNVRYAADNAVRHNAAAWDHDCAYSPHELNKHVELVKWTPSIHMPRWASRITLLVKRVWVERLQSISDADIRAEGVTEMIRSLIGKYNKDWEPQRWLDSDPGPNYCGRCAEKALKRSTVEDDFIAGGYPGASIESDSLEYCETCGKMLETSVLNPDYYLANENGEYTERPPDAEEVAMLADFHGSFGDNDRINREVFRVFWNSLYPDPALQWDANPWIVATEFERITP